MVLLKYQVYNHLVDHFEFDNEVLNDSYTRIIKKIQLISSFSFIWFAEILVKIFY
jgi:hypothetical protein